MPRTYTQISNGEQIFIDPVDDWTINLKAAPDNGNYCEIILISTNTTNVTINGNGKNIFDAQLNNPATATYVIVPPLRSLHLVYSTDRDLWHFLNRDV